MYMMYMYMYMIYTCTYIYVSYMHRMPISYMLPTYTTETHSADARAAGILYIIYV